jgi:hypothetical protein
MGAMLRRFRITVAMLSLTACILLAVLWVRSYYRMDQVYGHTSKTNLLHFASMRGQLTVRAFDNDQILPPRLNWVLQGESVRETLTRQLKLDQNNRDVLVYRFERNYGALSDGFFFPHWWAMAVVGAIGLAAASGRPKRFSLRGLLILVTVATVLLAVIASGL